MSCRASSCFLNADINRSRNSNKVSFAAVSYREATKELWFRSYVHLTPILVSILFPIINSIFRSACRWQASLSCGTSPTASPAEGCSLLDPLSSGKSPEIDTLLLGKSIPQRQASIKVGVTIRSIQITRSFISNQCNPRCKLKDHFDNYHSYNCFHRKLLLDHSWFYLY